jgi:hypothetical protein
VQTTFGLQLWFSFEAGTAAVSPAQRSSRTKTPLPFPPQASTATAIPRSTGWCKKLKKVLAAAIENMQDFELRHRLMHESLVHLVPISEYIQRGAGLISYDCFISFLHVFFQQHFRFQQHHHIHVEAKLPS